jgi:hypothetical protein
MNYNSQNCLLTLLMLVAGVTGLWAQGPQNNSPLSRYGLGDVENGYFTAMQSMGSVGSAYRSSTMINNGNPASLSELALAAYEVGAYAKYTRLTVGDYQQKLWYGNLSHLSLGVPIFNPLNEATKKRKTPVRVGLAFGFNPVSTVNYKVEAKDTLASGTPAAFRYYGKGNVNNLFVSSGVGYKGLSFGGSVGYNFGHITNDRYIVFQDALDTTSTSSTAITRYADSYLGTSSYMHALRIKLGAQYELWLNKKTLEEQQKTDNKVIRNRKILTIGATAQSAAPLKLTYDQYDIRIGTAIDTIRQTLNQKETGKLPMDWSIGIALRETSKYTIGIDVASQQWSKYQNPIQDDTLRNTLRIGVGAEWIPDVRAVGSLAKKIAYRAGAYYQTDPRLVDGVEVSRTAVTAGLGIPIRGPRGMVSFAQIGVEVGQQGTADFVKETYTRLSLGVTFNDNSWFYKQKYK